MSSPDGWMHHLFANIIQITINSQKKKKPQVCLQQYLVGISSKFLIGKLSHAQWQTVTLGSDTGQSTYQYIKGSFACFISGQMSGKDKIKNRYYFIHFIHLLSIFVHPFYLFSLHFIPFILLMCKSW